MAAHLGYATSGSGTRRVLVMHDWFGDRSNWDPLLPYLATRDFTYVFVDLRGYGASRQIAGTYDLEEAATDVLALAKHLGWDRYAVVGHSMSSLVMQRLLQLVPDQVTRGVAVTPVPPTSLRLDDGMVDMSKKLARATDERRLEVLKSFWGNRLSEGWIEFKAKRWGAVAEREAVAAYVDMYGRADISAAAMGIQTPLLILACEQDAPPFRTAALTTSMLPFYPNAKIGSLAESGHYPMQEQPPLLAALLERFLAAD